MMETIFSALVTGSDVARKKPFPDIYLEGARRIGMDPRDCLVVEDAISGIEAAHAAGMDAVGIPSTFTPEQLQEKASPEYILNQTKELVTLF
jgi:beta-phosphoglucomutase-like phosphatase (HAD superfamily)